MIFWQLPSLWQYEFRLMQEILLVRERQFSVESVISSAKYNPSESICIVR